MEAFPEVLAGSHACAVPSAHPEGLQFPLWHPSAQIPSHMTVGVLAANQPLDAEPSEFLPKHAGIRLVRRGWADRISKALIRRRAQRNPDVELEQFLASAYIPDRMPPVDLPGLKFEEPKSATWREQHRSVSVTS